MLSLVDHHRVVPQVYAALSPLVPEGQLSGLRSRYQDNVRKALWFSAQLIRITSHLELAGIKTLPYKGPILAQTAYGEVAQRQFSDLDILILPEDLPKAKIALLELGYRPGVVLAPQHEQAYLTAGYEYPFHAPHAANAVELQWRILPRFYSIDFNVADFFQRAHEINFGGHFMRTLRPEDLLLVLCVHAAKHLWVQLSWLCDIAKLVSSTQLDWNAIGDEAMRLGIDRIVKLNLLLARKLLGAPQVLCHSERSEESAHVDCHSEQSEESAFAGDCNNADAPPQTAFRRIVSVRPDLLSSRTDRSTIVLADEILHVIKLSSCYNTESLPYFRLMMRLRERRQDKIRLLWRLAVTPSVSEWSAIPLPKPLQPLYRLIRLSRLTKKLAAQC
jgi:Uncharacterised nucleotidyltransferase